MLCRRCKHDNPDENRYCGMCGTRLEMQAEPAEETSPLAQKAFAEVGSSKSSSSILGLDAEPERGGGFQREPTVSGPSFLGIGAEPPCKSKDYSYLLDYGEPRSHRGLWVMLVLLVVAALVGLQFRTELRARALPLYAALLARANPKPPEPPPAITPAPDATLAQLPAPAPQASASPGANDAPPSAGVASDAGSPSASSQGAPSKPDDNVAPPATEAKKKSAEPAKPDPEATENAAPKKKNERPAKYAHASREKPAPVAALEDNRLLDLAQKYIHGQGVRRDCTTGLSYLRQAMKRPSATAATQMGALYATGTCVQLDRVAAYRWFGSAQQMDPNNPWLSRERDELYAQMSSSERRQADRQ